MCLCLKVQAVNMFVLQLESVPCFVCACKHTDTQVTWYGWSRVCYHSSLLCTVWLSCLPLPFINIIFRTMCPLLLTLSLSVCLPLLQFSMQSDLCVSPACSFSFTPGSGLLGTIMPKHCQRRPENESSFSLHFSETSLSSNSYNIENEGKQQKEKKK